MHSLIVASCLVLALNVVEINSHGLLLEPAARSSAWRLDSSKFPAYYNGDNNFFLSDFNC